MMGVVRTEGEWAAEDGGRLWVRRWLPSSEATAAPGKAAAATAEGAKADGATADGAKAAVVLVHGLGEHGGRYEHVAGALAGAGCAVTSFDLRGHGRSSGRRGDTRLRPVLADLRRLLVETESQQRAVPLFLYGHSLGALVVLSLLAGATSAASPAEASPTDATSAEASPANSGRGPAPCGPTSDAGAVPRLAGAVVSAAPLRTALREQRGKVLLSRLLGRLLPGVCLRTGLDPSALSRDPAVVAAYRADPLVHDRASFGFARDALAATDALGGVPSLGVPLLLLHGTADRIAAVEGSRELAGRLRGEVTLHEYAGGFHEPHNDLDRERVIADIIEWLNARLAARA